ncbi:hypothetical protein DL96DRAFT_1821566 [Flagelloscypha sp. PMI_526]|nr:hypothetical protein DL96DRAFT_1821566 [Flagelloscypha sp. PMI_526]
MSSPLSSRATSSGPSEIDVPAELVLPILEYALSEMPCQSDLRFLLLSKDIYVFLLPKFYHTLEFGAQNSNGFYVDRQLFLRAAKPSSLLLIRRLAVGNRHVRQLRRTFWPFSNLTHLALWNRQGVRYPDAQGIPDLPLEELFMWNAFDRRELFRSLSPHSVLSSTLRRLGTYEFWQHSDFRRLEICQNLTHLLTTGHGYCCNIQPSDCFSLMKRDGLVCWIIIPAVNTVTEKQFTKSTEAFWSLCDPRVVLVKTTFNFQWGNGFTSRYWDQVSALWHAAETAILSDSTTITLIDQLIS